MGLGLHRRPLDFLLFSDFAVVIAYVHLYTLLMIAPIANSLSKIDRSLLEAARDAGASRWQTMANVDHSPEQDRDRARLDPGRDAGDGRLLRRARR